MMRMTKRVLPAMAIGLLISGGLYVYAGERRPSMAQVPTGKILVATEHLIANTAVKATDFKVEAMPLRYIPAGAISSPDVAVGRQVKWDVVPGDLLMEEKLAKPGENVMASLPNPHGERAVTIKVDEFVGVAGFVQPSSIVDVIATWDEDRSAHSKVILQNIKVLAVAQDNQRPDDPKAKVTSSVTLAVTPAEAEKIVLATERGTIRLAMRSAQETVVVKTTGITPALLTGLAPKPVPAKHVPAKPISAPVVQKKAAPVKVVPEPEPMVIYRGTQEDRVITQ